MSNTKPALPEPRWPEPGWRARDRERPYIDAYSARQMHAHAAAIEAWARADAIEQCVQVAEGFDACDTKPIAAAIRALKTQEQGS